MIDRPIKTTTITMAASVKTPKKLESIDCFACFDKNVTVYKLKGRKLESEGFNTKLHSLLDRSTTDVIDRLYEADAAVCRKCYTKVIKFDDFKTKTLSSALSFLSLGTHTAKRGTSSPQTPRSITDPSIPVRRKSRKQLKLTATRHELDEEEKECEQLQQVVIGRLSPVISTQYGMYTWQLIFLSGINSLLISLGFDGYK